MSETRRRGRPADPDALRFQSVGLRPADREYLRLWRLNPDNAPGTEADNLTVQLRLLIETARKFWPEGSAFHNQRRDERGRYTRDDQ